MRIHLIVGILLSAAIGSSSAVAEAVPVTFDFQGRVRAALVDQSGDPITLPSFRVGDPVMARLRYDTAMQDTGDGFTGLYVGPGAITIRINDLVFKYKGNLETTVLDNFNIIEQFFDSVSWQGITSTPARWPTELLPIDHAQFFLHWGQHTEMGFPLPSFLSNTTLPETANFSRIPGEGGVRVFPTADSNFIISFVLDPTELAATPEPATLLLVGTTAAGLGAARWWKRCRAGVDTR